MSNFKHGINSLLLQHRLSKPRLPLSMLHKKYTLKFYRFYQALKHPPLSYYRCQTLVLQVSHVSICKACQLDLSVFVESDSCPLLDLLFSVICLSYTIGANVLQLKEVAVLEH
jgi:hypothetical protein